MPGTLTHNGVRYCLFPSNSDSNEEYFPGTGPIRSARTDTAGQVRAPVGHSIPKTQAFREADLWIQSESMVTIKGWPAYPFSQGIFQLPAPLVDKLFSATTISRQGSGPDVQVAVNWDGLVIRKSFKIAELGAGVSAWPPRIIPDWSHFFLMFAPGERALIDRKRSLFSDLEPCAYGLENDAQGRATVVAADTRLAGSNMGAFCRLGVPPRWLSFRSVSDAAVNYGILPFVFGDRGELQMPSPTTRAKSGFARAFGSNEAVGNGQTWLSVDFGTSNTAVAVDLDGNGVGLLTFDERSRATNITAAVGLDPGLSAAFAHRFFPSTFQYTNPLPTMLIEFNERASFFPDSNLFPKRAIPAGLRDPLVLAEYSRAGYLKQDFKWKAGGDGPAHQRAFLEHLALVVAWQLRMRDEARQRPRIKVVFTCPLAFNTEQTENLHTTVSSFCTTLERSGFGPVEMFGSLVSESLANFHHVRRNTPQGGQFVTERHVVIDIGGGTTDISVFTGAGTTPLILDSLYVGGKDLAATLLLHRITHQNGWQPVANVLRLNDNDSPTPGNERQWTEMAQSLLINRMAADGQQGLVALASDFATHNMRDLLAELATLFVFVTTYAVRMASLPQGSEDVPSATKIWVWYAGLGSRLLDLFPLARGAMNRWSTAQGAMKLALSQFQETKDLVVFFDKQYSKDSVCRGALAGAMASQDAPVLPPALKTIWWGGLPGTDGFDWKDRYARRPLSDLQRQSLSTEALFECIDVALKVVGQTAFGTDWAPSGTKLADARTRFTDNFARACGAISASDPQSPSHPVRFVTDGMKSDVCELMEEQ